MPARIFLDHAATTPVLPQAREAMARGLDRRFERPERIRQWSYEFDPSGLEFLRRAIEHVAASRRATGRAKDDEAAIAREAVDARA